MISTAPLALALLLLPTLLQALPILPPPSLSNLDDTWTLVLPSLDAPAPPKKHLRLQKVEPEEPVEVEEGVEKEQKWIWAPDTESDLS